MKKYFIVTTNIRDGEYEYMRQSPVIAESEEQAIQYEQDDIVEWIKDDYREVGKCWAVEITKEEFEVISKYVS